MTCKEIDSLLPAYEEGLLTPGEKEGVEAHLAACESCRQSLADLRRAQELVRGLDEVEPPPFFEERIMARIREEAGGKRGLFRKLFYPFHIKIPIQALATILVAVLAFHLYEQGDPEMKRLAPLPIPLAEPAKEQAVAEPSGGSRLPEAPVPARPPPGIFPGPPGSGLPPFRPKVSWDGKPWLIRRPCRRRRGRTRSGRRAGRRKCPRRSHRRRQAGSEGVVSGMAREGRGQREDERLAAAPGRTALKQESGKATVNPVQEGQAKAKTPNAGIAAGEGGRCPRHPPGRWPLPG